MSLIPDFSRKMSEDDSVFEILNMRVIMAMLLRIRPDVCESGHARGLAKKIGDFLMRD